MCGKRLCFFDSTIARNRIYKNDLFRAFNSLYQFIYGVDPLAITHMRNAFNANNTKNLRNIEVFYAKLDSL